MHKNKSSCSKHSFSKSNALPRSIPVVNFIYVVNFCWVYWKSICITKHGQILVSKDVILASKLTRKNESRCSKHGCSKRNDLPCSIPDINMKHILFRVHTQIISRSGTKSYALVHHTFSSTNKSPSVSFFSRCMFLQISERMLVRTGNSKVHTDFRVRDYLISRSESLNFRSWSLVEMINWKPETGDWRSHSCTVWSCWVPRKFLSATSQHTESQYAELFILVLIIHKRNPPPAPLSPLFPPLDSYELLIPFLTS